MPSSSNRAAGRRPVDPRVDGFLRRQVMAGCGVRTVELLAGDASNRSYYRVHLEKGTLVLALLPGPFREDALPFLNVTRLFAEIPVRVPTVHQVAGAEGILLLEDLGDDLLQRHVETAGREDKVSLYRDAIGILARLQRRGDELRSNRYLPFRIAFDQEKFQDELSFFVQHYLGGLRRAVVSEDDRETLYGEFAKLAGELADLPRVLCHRDYHARNLMVLTDTLAVIDYQDARMGPPSYDLVSLLRDSYVRHDADFVDEMVEEYVRSGGRPEVGSEFETMALQRNLKALGTFGYQISCRGNDVYWPYIAPTLELVRTNLGRHPRWDRLRRSLARCLPEEIG